jgi:hypothetical protein
MARKKSITGGGLGIDTKIQKCKGRSEFKTVEIVEQELRIDSLRILRRMREKMECWWWIGGAGSAFSCGATRAV